jgi:uncharacterized protein YfaP (DUF2135 family)
LVALIALLGLAIAAGGVGASASGSDHAVAAKKKCKKKKKRSATSAKKKKCKKKKTVTPPVTPPTQPSGPTTRASITWDSSDEVDLHVFDESGNHDFYNQDESTIPDAVDHDQDIDGGPETFVDLRSPSTRTFSFYVCLFEYKGGHSGDVNVTADITDPGGAHRSIPIVLNGEGDEEYVTLSPLTGTGFLASPGFCGTPGP